MATLSSSSTLGNISASSLVKSAASLANTETTLRDDAEAQAFSYNPAGYYDTYKKYLDGRIANEKAIGTAAAAIKVIDLQNKAESAYKSFVTENLDIISTQYLTSGATDQAKLDYINGVLSNKSVQQIPSLYDKYAMQAYSLQQSIEYQAQVQQNAATSLASSNASAIEQGYKDSEDALKAEWDKVKGAFETGDEKGFNEAAAKYGDFLRSNGVNVPKGAASDYQIVQFGNDIAKISLYENIAASAGAGTSTYDSYKAKADALLHSSNFYQHAAEAVSPSNLYSPSVNQKGQVSEAENAISGYEPVIVKTPFGDIQVNKMQTTGSKQTPYQAMVTQNKNSQKSFDTLLNGIGLYKTTDTSGNVHYTVTNKAPKWMLDNGNIVVGERLTAIPTARGFQFITGTGGNAYGVSFDGKGQAALYREGVGGLWHQVGGQYGYQSTGIQSLQHAMYEPSKAMSTVHTAASHFIRLPVVRSIVHAIGGTKGRPSMVQRGGGGFNFTNAYGQSISAATYANLTGMNFYNLLNEMANRGDAGARQGMSFIGGNERYDPTKIAKGSNASIYNALTWGAQPNARITSPNTSGGKLTLPSGFKL